MVPNVVDGFHFTEDSSNGQDLFVGKFDKVHVSLKISIVMLK